MCVCEKEREGERENVLVKVYDQRAECVTRVYHLFIIIFSHGVLHLRLGRLINMYLTQKRV
jgi:hypothetical protein